MAPLLTPPAVQAASLEALRKSLGEPSEALRQAIFRATNEETLVENGTRIDSQAILDDVPAFVARGLEVVRRLTPTQRTLVKLPAGLFSLIIDEALRLEQMKRDHDAMLEAASLGPASETRREMREGIALRNVTYNALRSVLGKEGMAEVDAVVGTGDTPERLSAGLAGLATLLRKMLEGDPLERMLLSEFGLDEGCARSLTERAERVRHHGVAKAPPDRVITARMLDAHDGRVLHLVAVMLRAFRAAHRADTSIVVPELPSIGHLFDGRVRA